MPSEIIPFCRPFRPFLCDGAGWEGFERNLLFAASIHLPHSPPSCACCASESPLDPPTLVGDFTPSLLENFNVR